MHGADFILYYYYCAQVALCIRNGNARTYCTRNVKSLWFYNLLSIYIYILIDKTDAVRF
jgi:hypothetical protein